MQILNGANFWNPYEGLKSGADLIKLARSWVQSDAPKDPVKSKTETAAALGELERRARGVIPLVKASQQEWFAVRRGNRTVPNPIQISVRDRDAIEQLRWQLEQLRTTIATSDGGIQLGDLAISYPRAEFRFTTDTYFDFVFRSLDEILVLARERKLVGPKSNQSW